MDIKNFLLAIAGIVFFVLIAWAVYNYGIAGVERVEDKAKELYIKSLTVGKGVENYVYAYEENLDGYPTKTTLIKSGKNKKVVMEGLFVKKEIYYLENDTLLCVSFENRSVCSSVKNDTTMKSYLKWLDGQFFNDEKTKKDNETLETLVKRGAIIFEGIEKGNANGNECDVIKFKLDYTNLTLTDMMKLGITQSTPTKINGEICYSKNANAIYTKKFDYTRLGKKRISEFKLITSDWDYSGTVGFDGNITDGAVDLLMEGNEKDSDFIDCLEKNGTEKDKCIYSMALGDWYEQLCPYAGTKSDFCMLNFASKYKDSERCDKIVDNSTRDDCYIEVANRAKDTKPCGMIGENAKKATCIEVATKNETTIEPVSEPELPAEETNKTNDGLEPANVTAEEKDALQKIMKEIGKES